MSVSNNEKDINIAHRLFKGFVPGLVSIIVPSYNRPEYLPLAVKSALKQDYPSSEVIVTDDCSAKDTFGSIKNLMDDRRVRFFRNEQNLGQMSNFLTGFQQSRGEFIAILHDDDMWEPEFLAKLVPVLQTNPEVSICFSNHYIMLEDGLIDPVKTELCTRNFKRTHLQPGMLQPFFRNALVDLSVPVCMASVIRASAIVEQEFPQSVHDAYDRWIAYLCSRKGQAAYFIPDFLTRYREHSASATSLMSVHLRMSIIKHCELMLEYPDIKVIHPELRGLLSEYYCDLGLYYLENGELRKARQALKTSLQYSLTKRACVALSLSLFPPSLSKKMVMQIRNLKRTLKK